MCYLLLLYLFSKAPSELISSLQYEWPIGSVSRKVVNHLFESSYIPDVILSQRYCYLCYSIPYPECSIDYCVNNLLYLPQRKRLRRIRGAFPNYES